MASPQHADGTTLFTVGRRGGASLGVLGGRRCRHLDHHAAIDK
jgi:hypothetical protein